LYSAAWTLDLETLLHTNSFGTLKRIHHPHLLLSQFPDEVRRELIGRLELVRQEQQAFRLA
jgi:hypothetical protein